MLRNLKKASARLALVAALAGSLALTVCDQQADRIDRAKELADAAMDQISGREIVEADGPQSMQTASVQDRAIAGTILNDIAFGTETERPQFAVGSIIAKPKDLPPPAMMVDDEAYADDAYEAFEEVASEPMGDGETLPPPPPVASAPAPQPLERSVTVERAMPIVKLDPKAREKSLQDIEQATRELESAAAAEPDAVPVERRTRSLTRAPAGTTDGAAAPRAMKMARRSAITREAIVKQKDANEVMLDTLSKYGMNGQVALSREGQMVIQIGGEGADPTRFVPQEVGAEPGGAASVPRLAVDDATGCPETADLVTVQANAALATECVIQDLRASGQFEYVEKDYIFQNQFVRRPKNPQPVTPVEPAPDGTPAGPADPIPGTTPPVTLTDVTPNDPLWSLQWNFQNNGSDAGQSGGGAGFQSFWTRQANEGSKDVVVAVVDTGLQMQHPDIKDSQNIANGWDMVSDPSMGNDGDGRDSDANDPGDLCDPTVPYASDTFHGTHVAGTIGAAASNNGSGVAGGAWNVTIVPVRALGKCGGRLSDINDAIRWAGGLIPAEAADGSEVWNEHPADIINLSIGLFGACPASLQDAIDAVTERGVMVVSAAGNARVSTKFYAPGGCQNVISVAAGDARGQIAPYSNFGPNVTILAPGGDLSRDDNGDGRPDGVLSTKASSNCYDPVTGEGVDNCYYAYEQGTSMAAPHVSAALALLMARDPDATSEALQATLMSSLDLRAPEQCAGECSKYPGTEPIPGSGTLCLRPCGGLLNLANVPTLASDGGGK